MGAQYRAIGWNRQKKLYDGFVATGVCLYLGAFVLASAALQPEATVETVLIRAFGTCALVLLHVVLAIGPVCRLDPRFLPLLYNRRHLGVTTFLVALAHGSLATFQFHALGELNPLVSLFASHSRFDSLAHFPFQPLGACALAILFLMAATSHDFWLANLSAPAWKALHMLVYAAYALVVGHVALGVLQAESSPAVSVFLGAGLFALLALHLAAAQHERPRDRELSSPRADGFVDVCAVGEIPEKRARVACLAGERVAVFRYDGLVSAVSNACQHQNGPLGEGRILDGCITGPCHGYQYRPASGSSPPPFSERVPTFDVKIERGRVLVHPEPHAPGTEVAPARIEVP